MQTFSKILKEINIHHNSLLTEESKIFGVEDNHLIESIDVLSKNLIIAYLLTEELTQDSVSAAIKSLPADTTELTRKEIDVDGDKLSVDWNSETGSVKLSVNGTSVAINDTAHNLDTLAELISKAVSSEAIDAADEPVNDPETNKKLAVLKNIIKPKLIVPFANSAADATRIMNALKNYIKTGSDEKQVTGELDQRAIVDFLFDVMTGIMNNRNLASLVSKNATVTAVSESLISEASKKSKKKGSDIIDVKLDMLLRLGLVDRKLYSRAKKALNNQKSAGSVPLLRNLLFDILNSLIAYIKKDPTLYNRIRINVMKEMAGMLPPSKAVRAATQSGKTAAETEMKREVPEEYTNDHFTKEAWLHGYDSWDGIKTIANEEDMKTFKEFNESVNLSEISAITDVVNGLEVLSTSPFKTLEEAETEIRTLLSTIGLSFDKLTDGDIPLDTIDGGNNAVLSVFSADDTVEEEIEGDMILKTSISEGEAGVTVSAEIIVCFEDGESVALTDVEFEPEAEEDNEEPDMKKDLEEEFESGKVFNVILFKPTNRSFSSSIIQADSIDEVRKIVASEMPMYVVHSINPIDVTDTTQY